MPTKYPIILVHGIALKGFKFFRAFGRIEDILRDGGNTVYISKIDGFGTTETNSIQLAEEINSIISETGAEKVNIIAHSKGGLDSKRMICELSMEDKVASLTTLCTPHAGSPIATMLLKLPKPLLSVWGAFIDLGYKIFGDKHPSSLEVCRELALVESIERSSMEIPDGVYCQSYSTTLEKSRDDFLMGIPLMFSHFYEKCSESDGLVSSDSAKFGEYKGSLDGSVSHTAIVDFMADKKTREKIFAFYTALAKELEARGF